MLNFTIFSWNTQGDWTKKEKLIETEKIFSKSNVIGLIQEGGAWKDGKMNHIISYGGHCVGAKNNRCTNYILIDESLNKLVRIVNLKTIGGGEAGRTAMAIGINRTLIVSWHSIAAKNNEDTANLIRDINSYHSQNDKYNIVVIGGDFNETPKEVREIIKRLFKKRKHNGYEYQYVFRTGKRTHCGRFRNKELDFFIILSKSCLKRISVTMHSVKPSDHNPVILSNLNI